MLPHKPHLQPVRDLRAPEEIETEKLARLIAAGLNREHDPEMLVSTQAAQEVQTAIGKFYKPTVFLAPLWQHALPLAQTIIADRNKREGR